MDIHRDYLSPEELAYITGRKNKSKIKEQLIKQGSSLSKQPVATLLLDEITTVLKHALNRQKQFMTVGSQISSSDKENHHGQT